MAKLINADKAIKKQMEKHDALGAEKLDKYTALAVLSAIAEEEAVDAVEVVRCRDCVHGKADGEELILCAASSKTHPKSFYCASGMNEKMLFEKERR